MTKPGGNDIPGAGCKIALYFLFGKLYVTPIKTSIKKV